VLKFVVFPSNSKTTLPFSSTSSWQHGPIQRSGIRCDWAWSGFHGSLG
jgi:hypothetical protein